ncbi:MbnP family protein [Fulvivirga sediminis]|uniref:Copper-binding protein MbnP-like domain-containing protein n=1 Tax=Fulvivirga sediminis TaxID=2803949 RepID=A0A937F453_9BACT|nr:MbnP family protein [Fulvivirga sediminis]MBL3656012.1 hypothetical protein [Fulvivirga sediminis]
MKNTLFFTGLLFAFFLMVSCSEDDETIIKEVDKVIKEEVIVNGSKVTLTFNNVIGTEDFELNHNYTVGGINYNFKSLRYWVSNVGFKKTDGSVAQIPNSYYLIENTEDVAVQEGAYTYEGQKREDVTISDLKVGTYTSVIFSVGVDQEHNDNLSLNAGELSSMVGMTNVSWMWHTSYIFTSLKGTAENGDSKDIEIETGLNANYRTIELKLPQAIEVINDSSYQININANVLTTLNSFDPWENPVVGASQPQLMKAVSDNFATSFFSISVPEED